MISIILVSTTILFCFGLFVIFRLYQNSKKIEYSIEKMEFSEVREYNTEPLREQQSDVLQHLNQQIIALTQQKDQLIRERQANLDAVGMVSKAQEKIRHQVITWQEAVKDIKENTIMLTVTKKVKPLKSKVVLALETLNLQTNNTTVELAAIQNQVDTLTSIIPADEADLQKQRAAERIQKLRNLSFNINAADPNNEFETVPAYIRRNLELYNTITNVENFYSNYEIKKDETDNSTKISTINTFLDGKKPD